MASSAPAPATPFPALRALSFDIFGTHVDWEGGIHDSLQPLIAQLPHTHTAAVSFSAAIAAFDRHETRAIREMPTIRWEDALRQAYAALAAEWGVTATPAAAEAMVAHVAEWKAFPDTVAAMQRLGAHFKLIALSNTSKALFAGVQANALRDVKFDAVYLAEEIGSYKPDRKNFEFLVHRAERDLGVKKEQLLHVGHGVLSDQVPADEMGISHVWIERGHWNWGTVAPQEGLRSYGTLADLAADAERGLKEGKELIG